MRSTRSSTRCSTPTATCCRSRCASVLRRKVAGAIGPSGPAGRDAPRPEHPAGTLTSTELPTQDTAGDLTPAERLSDSIDSAEREGPGLIVAVDGRGGAGKSTLARELELLRDDVAVIAGDDFYRALAERTREALTPIEAVDLSFHWERLRDEALAPLL